MVIPPILIASMPCAPVSITTEFSAPPTHDLERETRDDRLLIGHCESEPPHDAVGIRSAAIARRPAQTALRSG